MPRNPESRRVLLRAIAAYLAAIAVFAFAVPVTPSFAQASGHVRVKIVKAGLLIGGGAGSALACEADVGGPARPPTCAPFAMSHSNRAMEG